MAREWTQAQKAAISARNADILVSAAAGSGKTAVLVERIIQRITDEKQPVDLDRLLVVTFTNAAAAEMRQRIGAALSEKLEKEPGNELLIRQLALLPKASITTIHAFCHSMLRANFNLLGLDPTFRIADDTENKLIRLAALEEVIEEMYEDPVFAEDFLKLTEAYLNIKKPEDFYSLINRIYDFSMSLPEPDAWLKQSEEHFLLGDSMSFSDSAFLEPILSAAKGCILAICRKYDAMIALADNDDGGEVLAPFLAEEKVQFTKLLGLTTYDAFYRALEELSFRTIPRVPKHAQPVYRETVQSIRDGVKKTDVGKLKKDYFALTEEEQTRMVHKLHPLMRCLCETVRCLGKRFDEKKDEKNILNYNDLEHGCYRLFVDENGEGTALAESVKNQFDEILIDEYQDTSALQEAIFHAIKKEGGLFLVGDIKQSIYRFRNTNPLLFRSKKERFVEEEAAPERKIILSKNFRSRASVLDSINFVFDRVMSEQVGEITYNEEEMLYPGLPYPEMAHPIPQGTELCLVEMSERSEDFEDFEKAELEARFAAQKIQELLGSNYQVLGKNGVRNIRYRDICILFRSPAGVADVYVKTLSEFGIPCYSDAGSSFLQSEEITAMLALLKIIDNPHQDIPLLTVLRSQLYALSPEELAEIRLADRRSDFYDALKKRSSASDELGIKLKNFTEKLDLYREKSRQLDVAELVWYLYMETGFYEAQATLPGGTLRRLNLRLLYTRAASFEKTGLKGLYSFMQFIDEFASAGGDYDSARTAGEEQDVVRIMSIHKSKGLEFPVVILGNIGKEFYMPDLKDNVIIHSKLGFGPLYVDTDLKLVHHNGAWAAVKQAVYEENLSEELRILYVAMTRAREKLILLGSGKKLDEQMEQYSLFAGKKEVIHNFAAGAKSYLDWIFLALSSDTEGKILQHIRNRGVSPLEENVPRFYLELIHADDLASLETGEYEEETARETGADSSDILLDSSYDFLDETDLPAKVTVSEVKRRMTAEEPDSVYLYPRPAFLMERSKALTAAEVGTATHSVLERLDFADCDDVEDIRRQIQNMEQEGYLSKEEADAISAEKIFAFVRSEIGERICQAERVLREVSFGISAEAEPLLGQKGQVMLQGIIDCVIFEKDGISILDYKTDKGPSPEEIAERYRVQLDCYAQAAEKLFSQKVGHRYLYLFHYDLLIEV